jgi:hypothetical protein
VGGFERDGKKVGAALYLMQRTRLHFKRPVKGRRCSATVMSMGREFCDEFASCYRPKDSSLNA